MKLSQNKKIWLVLPQINKTAIILFNSYYKSQLEQHYPHKCTAQEKKSAIPNYCLQIWNLLNHDSQHMLIFSVNWINIQSMFNLIAHHFP